MKRGILLRVLWRGDLLTHNVYYNPHRHVTDVFSALGTPIGVNAGSRSSAGIIVSDNERNQLEDLLTGLGVRSGDEFITMNINASSLCLERRWPLERFVELTRMLLENHRHRILLIGDNDDITYVNRFLGAINNDMRVTSLAGRLNVGMLVVLFSKTKVFITNDSGPLHVAVYANTPTVSLFGPEAPERYGPVHGDHDVFYSGVYCSPCLNAYNQKMAPCRGENICMQKIAVKDVYGAVAARLAAA
jgi:ADP-heptose:LPS heptosyltransferase